MVRGGGTAVGRGFTGVLPGVASTCIILVPFFLRVGRGGAGAVGVADSGQDQSDWDFPLRAMSAKVVGGMSLVVYVNHVGLVAVAVVLASVGVDVVLIEVMSSCVVLCCVVVRGFAPMMKL